MPEPILSAVIPNAKAVVTPDDSDELPHATVGVRVQNPGVLVVQMWGNPAESVPIPVEGGEYVTGQIRRILTASTASGFVVDYIAS